MVFKNNIPQPTDFLSNSQVDFLNNNAQLDISMGVNHFPFSDLTANNGKHKFVELVAGALPIGLAANEVTLYSKAVSTGPNSATELFMTRDASGVEIQLTVSKSFNGTLIPNSNQTGMTFLPGGICLIWAKVALSNPGPTVVTFPFGGFNNNFFGAYCTAEASAGQSIPINILQGSTSRTGFTVNQGSTAGFLGPMYYLAIGN